MYFMKGIFAQMLASAAQVAPHIADTVQPALKKNAAAAAKACSGKDSACSFRWAEAKSGDVTNAGTECNALSAIAPLLAQAGDAPRTAKTGGTSSGSSGSGGGSSSNSTTTGKGDGKGDGKSDGKSGSGNGGKSAASKLGGSAVLGLVMTGAAVLLL